MSVSRRSVLLGAFAVAGCQAAGSNDVEAKTISSFYDGDYKFKFFRTWEKTSWTVSSGNWEKNKDKLELLSVLDVRVRGGEGRLTGIYDVSSGNNYGDFSAIFYEGDILKVRATVGYEVAAIGSKVMRFKVGVSESIKTPRGVIYDVGRFDPNHKAKMSISAA